MSAFIIAEIGINHNGDMNLAKKLIDIAVIAGCDAVKFQKRTVEKVYAKEYLDGFRKVRGVIHNEHRRKDWNSEKKNIRRLINIVRKKALYGLLQRGI